MPGTNFTNPSQRDSYGAAMAVLTEPLTTEIAPPTTRFGSWRYPEGEGRDLRLDLLRGYALAAMSVNHFGLHESYVHSVSGRSSFLISAAEAFLFISGFTLGFISMHRSVETVTQRVANRTWIVYLATLGISFGLSAVALRSNVELWGWFEAGEWDSVWHYVAQVITMRATFNGADILIAYVIYLGAAVVALRLMAKGRSDVVIGSTLGLYVLSQITGPDSVNLGFASFRVLIPNAPLFLGGLVIGYHREAINTWWSSRWWHRIVDAAVVVVAIGLAWLHQRGWLMWQGLGEFINGAEPTEPLGRREVDMPIPALGVVLLYMRFFWIAVDALWVPLRRVFGWLLLPLGQASLFTFVMHLLAIPLVVNLPLWPEDELGRAGATVWVVGYLAVIYLSVLVRERVLLWLRSGGDVRDGLRAHGPALTVAVLCAALVLAALFPDGAAGEFGDF